jgi:hypothetical protein
MFSNFIKKSRSFIGLGDKNEAIDGFVEVCTPEKAEVATENFMDENSMRLRMEEFKEIVYGTNILITIIFSLIRHNNKITCYREYTDNKRS